MSWAPRHARKTFIVLSKVFLPILSISGVNVESGLPSNIVDLGCQCHVWFSFQYCWSRVSMSRLVFLPILSISGVNVASGLLPILSISGVNVTSGLPSNIVDLGCLYRVWSSFQYCWFRVSMSRLVFLPILSISGVNVASGLPSNIANVASGLPSNIFDLGCQCRVWSSFQYYRSRVSMSRLVFLPILQYQVSMSRLIFPPILSISGANVSSGIPSNIVDLRSGLPSNISDLMCECRVWSSFQ